MIDLSELMTDPDFGPVAFNVTRYSAAALDVSGGPTDGQWILGSPTEIAMQGVVEPASQNDLVKWLPEGERQGNFIRIWCATELIMGDGKTVQSDIITLTEEVVGYDAFKIAFAKRWQAFGYWFVIAQGYVTNAEP